MDVVGGNRALALQRIHPGDMSSAQGCNVTESPTAPDSVGCVVKENSEENAMVGTMLAAGGSVVDVSAHVDAETCSDLIPMVTYVAALVITSARNDVNFHKAVILRIQRCNHAHRTEFCYKGKCAQGIDCSKSL